MLVRSAFSVAIVMVAVGCEPTNQGYAPEQPIKYSHAVHAGAMEIPCQYCHFGAERGRHAAHRRADAGGDRIPGVGDGGTGADDSGRKGAGGRAQRGALDPRQGRMRRRV